MNSNYPDITKAIAGAFFVDYYKNLNRSKKAYRKIKAWQNSRNNTDTDVLLRKQIDTLVMKSFLNEVSATYILEQENFFSQANFN